MVLRLFFEGPLKENHGKSPENRGINKKSTRNVQKGQTPKLQSTKQIRKQPTSKKTNSNQATKKKNNLESRKKHNAQRPSIQFSRDGDVLLPAVATRVVIQATQLPRLRAARLVDSFEPGDLAACVAEA